METQGSDGERGQTAVKKVERWAEGWERGGEEGHEPGGAAHAGGRAVAQPSGGAGNKYLGGLIT